MPYVNIRLNVLILICIIYISSSVNCENKTDVKNETQSDFTTELIEEGRTLAHRTLKRFMLIAPAIFFKLGIAFTLLLLVTLVAVNNGFIGFLILVVGLSSVLARLQRSGPAAPLVQHVPIPYHAHHVHALPQLSHFHHHPWIDRSDSVDATQKANRNIGYLVNRQNYDSNSDLRNTGVYYKGYSPSD